MFPKQGQQRKHQDKAENPCVKLLASERTTATLGSNAAPRPVCHQASQQGTLSARQGTQHSRVPKATALRPGDTRHRSGHHRARPRALGHSPAAAVRTLRTRVMMASRHLPEQRNTPDVKDGKGGKAT